MYSVKLYCPTRYYDYYYCLFLQSNKSKIQFWLYAFSSVKQAVNLLAWQIEIPQDARDINLRDVHEILNEKKWKKKKIVCFENRRYLLVRAEMRDRLIYAVGRLPLLMLKVATSVLQGRGAKCI